MTPEQIKLACILYRNELQRRGYVCEQFADADGSPTRVEQLQHVRHMCNRTIDLVDKGKIEKAMRWLGFMQGVLYAHGIFTVYEMMEHNRSGEAVS